MHPPALLGITKRLMDQRAGSLCNGVATQRISFQIRHISHSAPRKKWAYSMPMVDPSAFALLSEHQRVTLRLYQQHLQIKEIAKQLGISESTVNQRLTRCREILGAPSSRTAAKWFAHYEEQNGLYRKSAYHFSTMGQTVVLSADEGVDLMGTSGGNQDDERAKDEHSAAPHLDDVRKSIPLPFPSQRAPDNRLHGWTRVALVIAVAAFLLLILMAVALLGIGLQDALVSLQHLFVRQS